MEEERRLFGVTIRNCKNFDLAEFNIEPNKLNVKFAPNGTGKSSIAEGIRCAIEEDPELLKRITPFKYRDIPDEHSFSCEGLDGYHSVEVFDEQYVNSVAFVQSGIFASSFDVFVKTIEYEATTKRINEILDRVQQCLKSEAMEKLRNALGVFASSISGNSGLTNDNNLRANAPVKKGLSNGNPRESVPVRYENFRSYICSKRLSQWSKWHASGHRMLEASDRQCPFCGQALDGLEDVVSDIHNDYVPSNAENLDKASSGIVAAKDYLSSESFDALEAMIHVSEPLTQAQENYFTEVVSQASVITANLRNAENLNSYFSLAKLGKNISKALSECAIDLSLLSHFDSPECISSISEYNEALNQAQEEAQILFGIINRQKDKLAASLAGFENEINSFFSGAGYPYSIRIEASDDGQCTVRLIHSSQYQISDVSGVLSYGERNALALVFFMYSALANRPDLIILDDPITSFDGHKRFAILHMLFLKDSNSSNSLKNKTVILFTHEYEVVFDIEHTLKHEFQPLAKTTLLHISNDSIEETVINREDMKPVRILFQDIARTADLPIVRFAYARKLLELDNDKANAWHLLSSLFHHRTSPLHQNGEPMDDSDIQSSLSTLNLLTDCMLDYDAMLQQINDKNAMYNLFKSCNCKYEKLQIARIALDGEGIDRVSKKLLDETLHVDNGFIFQLDPRQFELISDSIIEQCDQVLQKAIAG
ncbi:hypothetical protein [Paraeggerthella sp. Marseille-Q4926]|uniref:AAA family ATPase n=1 Tax=Paraeggerthella sp. Marseille-Q4926 TaxID=2866587 RepID=UPI001CE3F38D|nr:hypothetical protein [Paraeggerthella sp. Marseille-Q4926]